MCCTSNNSYMRCNIQKNSFGRVPSKDSNQPVLDIQGCKVLHTEKLIRLRRCVDSFMSSLGARQKVHFLMWLIYFLLSITLLKSTITVIYFLCFFQDKDMQM